MKFAIVDIETTGGYPASNAITEIAVIVHDGMQVVGQYESLVHPGQKIPFHITALTGIDNEMVADAPTFETIAPILFNLLSDCVFVAHNVNFDFSFIRHQFQQCGYHWNPQKLCTVRLSRKTFVGLPSYSLGNLCRALKIPLQNRHRAGGDVLATVKLFEKCIENSGFEHIHQMLKRNSGEQWLPLHINKDQILRLPESTGVYYFHDNKGKVIYVGKAINIRKRVTGHFTHHDVSAKRQAFLQKIQSITYFECASELQAIVFESTEIRRLWPAFNQSQKRPRNKFALYQYEDNRGYIRLLLDKKKKNLPALCRFNGLNEGKLLLRQLQEEFGLHEKLCHIDKSPLGNEDRTLLESPDIYNNRIKEGIRFISRKLPSFLVKEKGIHSNEHLYLLVEHGSFWGMGFAPNHLSFKSTEELKSFLQPYSDNQTIKKYIRSYMQQHPEKIIELAV